MFFKASPKFSTNDIKVVIRLGGGVGVNLDIELPIGCL
jgi:hypothetical protein